MGTCVLIVTGPAAVGKTTTARRAADQAGFAAAHISLDEVRLWRRAGYADPSNGWGVAARRQYATAQAICAVAVHSYVASGISVVLDDAVSLARDRPDIESWTVVLGRRPRLLVLDADLPTLLSRNVNRPVPLPEHMVQAVHQDMALWRSHPQVDRYDTTGKTIQESAGAVLEYWARSPFPSGPK